MRILFLILVLSLIPLSIQAQSFLNSIDKAGSLIQDDKSKLDFEISTGSINFSLKSRYPAFTTSLNSNYTIWDFDLGISTAKGNKDLFSKGDFNPGANFSTSSSQYFQDNGPGYWALRERFNYEVQEIKSVNNVVNQNATLELTNKVNHNFGIDFTVARAFRYDFVIAITASAKRIYNSPGNLKTEQVSQILSTGNTSDGKQYTVSDNEDRYYGNLLDVENKGEIGFDMFWNFLKLGKVKKDNPSIALLGSIVTSYSKYSKPYYSLSLGPSFQPPSKTRYIVFATLLEFFKINKDTDWKNFVKNNFRVRLYVGVPFDVFK
jgi:hypothetical protein